MIGWGGGVIISSRSVFGGGVLIQFELVVVGVLGLNRFGSLGDGRVAGLDRIELVGACWGLFISNR